MLMVLRVDRGGNRMRNANGVYRCSRGRPPQGFGGSPADREAFSPFGPSVGGLPARASTRSGVQSGGTRPHGPFVPDEESRDEMDEWTLNYTGYDPDEEGLREALCTLGNGVLASRGSAPESRADGVHYPGTYRAGLFNRLDDEIDGIDVSNESMVNLPNWLVLQFRVEDGPWFAPGEADLEEYRLQLDLRRAVVTRHMRVSLGGQKRLAVTQRRFVHMVDPKLAALETTFRAEGFAGRLTVRSGIDSAVRNSGVERYRDLSDLHLDVLSSQEVDPETVRVVVETNQSHVRVAEAARTRVRGTNGDLHEDVPRRWFEDDGVIGHELDLDLVAGEAVTVEKVVAIVVVGDPAISEPAESAVRAVGTAPGFDELLYLHVAKWDQLWDRCEIRFGEQPVVQRILNLHTLHALQTTSHNTIDRDVGAPARGLHGEAYRGHIFWDEVFILPYLNLRMPVLTRSLLLYRYRRLDEARKRAAREGHHGALFPWQSGSDGREESQEMHLNPVSGEWKPDNSQLQRHIDLAIAYNVWQYVETTADLDFLRYYGLELMVEIARFFSSLAEYDRLEDRYHIRGVMGPDEFHDGYPDRDEPGLDDNAYTNVMAVWMLQRTFALLELLPEHVRNDACSELDLTRAERDRWEDMARRMYVPFHADGIISQFRGYGELEEFDWAGYRQRHGDIQRLDRILHAEGDTPNRYKVAKQADVLMLFYLLSAEELEEIMRTLGYDWTPDRIPETIEYYRQRTSHGSTLSAVVHAWLLARSDRARSWELFEYALSSDVADIQGGTTPEGIHLGAMTGTLDLVQRGYTGLVVERGLLSFDPALPTEVRQLDLLVYYRGHHLRVSLNHHYIRVSAPASDLGQVSISCEGERRILQAGETLTFELEHTPDT
jgi:trehalose/maltose hydrolase-like predicted phosphorylase